MENHIAGGQRGVIWQIFVREPEVEAQLIASTAVGCFSDSSRVGSWP